MNETTVEQLIKRNYISICNMFNDIPSQRLLKNLKYDMLNLTLSLENSNISDKNIKSVVYTLMKCKSSFNKLSLSHNPYFKDHSMRQLLEFLQDAFSLKGLSIEKVNVSDSSILKLIELLPHL